METVTFHNDNVTFAPASAVEIQQAAPKHLGRTRLVPGLTLFSYNTVTGEIHTAVFKVSEWSPDGIRHKVAHQQNLLYIQALNRANA